ncbi:MAG: TonB family protein [Elusimicrobia bacterium]|nr:TonB family protein [Elusimicrobiota bacterium]
MSVKKPDLFEKCLAASFALHAGLLIGGQLTRRPAAPPPVEVDLTVPVLGGDGPARLGAPKRLVPAAKGIPRPAESPVPLKPPPAVEPPKDWVLPGPNTKLVEKPPAPAPTPGGASEGTGTAAKVGGSGAGADDGVPGGTGTGGSGLLALPRLLNRDELLANLRRYYPESERRAGREGSVLVALHIGVDGRVDPVDIVSGAGAAFDAAAREVAKRMRFSPAIGRAGPVPVKLNQAIFFQLQD